MKFHQTKLQDVYLLEPKVFGDSRGYFFESFNAKSVAGTPLEKTIWVQDNESKSTKGVLRGLHFQWGEYSQAKLVRAVVGEIFDVAVDLRVESPTFGQWHGEVLSEDNKHQMLIPQGFAHGFLVLSDIAIVNYKCDQVYNKEHESGILYNDPDIGIDWPLSDLTVQLSEKDKNQRSFKQSIKF